MFHVRASPNFIRHFSGRFLQASAIKTQGETNSARLLLRARYRSTIHSQVGGYRARSILPPPEAGRIASLVIFVFERPFLVG
jgi:hypothetical protein